MICQRLRIWIGKGTAKRSREVLVYRRRSKWAAMAARRMEDDGRPRPWIAEALRIPRDRVDAVLASNPVWGDLLRRAA